MALLNKPVMLGLFNNGVPKNGDANTTAWQNTLLAAAKAQAAMLAAAGFQAHMVFDLEAGAEYSNGVSYAGEPRLIGSWFGALSSILDKYVRCYTDAGLRIGCLIRETTLGQDAASGKWTHVLPFDVDQRFDLLRAKLRWMRDHGFTIAYVDSHDVKSPGAFQAIQSIAQLMPDIDICPELYGDDFPNYFGVTTPYRDYNQSLTPAGMRSLRRVPDDATTWAKFPVKQWAITDALITSKIEHVPLLKVLQSAPSITSATTVS